MYPKLSLSLYIDKFSPFRVTAWLLILMNIAVLNIAVPSLVTIDRASKVASGEESPCNAGDAGSIPGSGRSPGGGNGNPLQYSCLENSTDRGACQATIHGVAESDTPERLSTCAIPYLDKKMSLGYYNLCKLHPYFHVQVLQGKKKKRTFSTKLNLS